MKKNCIKALALIPAAVLLVGCGRVTIDPNDYLEVKYEGMDTRGTATYDIDFEKMVKDNLKAFGIESKKDDKDIERAVNKLEKYLRGELDKTSSLSNGDEIVFEWDDDDVEKLEKRYKIKLKVSDKNITVADLESAKEFDPFDYITLEYEGTAPNSYVKINVDDKIPVDDISFYADPSSGVSNGDKIKVTFGSSYFDEDEIMDWCFEEGYIPTALSKEFTVEGVKSYVGKIKDIDKASYDKMDKYARDEFDDLVDTWEKKKLKDIELVGVNLYTPKDDSSYSWEKNALVYVYKVTVNKPEGFEDGEAKEEATEPATEAATEAVTTTAEAATEAGATTTTVAEDADKAATTTTAEKKDDKKDDKKDNDTFEYYYFTIFTDVFTPDSKDSEYPASYVTKPEYYQFFGSVSGDAFVKGNVLFEGYETLDDLNKAMEDKYSSFKVESNIKKK